MMQRGFILLLMLGLLSPEIAFPEKPGAQPRSKIETAPSDKEEKGEKPEGGFEEPHEGEEPSKGIPHTGREPGRPEKEKPEKDKKKKSEKPEKPEGPEKPEKPKRPEEPQKPQPPVQPGTWPDVYKKKPEPEKPPEEPGKLKKFERGTKKKRGEDNTAERTAFFLFRIFELWIHAWSGYAQEGYQRYEFLKWPYHKKQTGIVKWSKDAKPNWALDMRGVFQKEISGINGPGASLKLRSPVFFSLGADHIQYLERCPGGNLDKLSFSKFTFNLQLPFTGVLWDIGAGGTILAGETKTPGALLSTSLDIFPARPLAIHFAISNSWMREGGQIQDLSLDLGFYIKRFEIFAGYRALTTAGSPSLHGPRMGVGLWF